MASSTIRDVARAADVSVASVSRVLNDHANVHPDTRERVRAAISALGYVPHAGARSLSLARTQAIGVVLPDLHGEFFSEIVRGMDRAVTPAGYHLLLSNMHADADLAAQAMRTMRGRVDGLIVMAPHLTADALEAALPRGLPTVMLNTVPSGDRAGIRVDNAAGIRAAVAHLAATGRRAPVHIAGPVGNVDAVARRDAFAAAMRDHFPDAPVRIVAGDFFEESGTAAVAALVAQGTPFDAIVAANDMMAFGALQALRDAGRQVPEQVAVTGFDDVPLARYLGLTTAHVPLVDMGSRAIDRLLALISPGLSSATGGARDPDLIIPELIVRRSSGAPETL